MLPARRAVTIVACSLAIPLLAVSGSHAQRSGPEPCRQGLLALIVMIDAEEHGRPHYQTTAKAVVESCGPPAATRPAAAAPPPLDKDLCGKLALSMLDSAENGRLESREFAEARDAFAGSCIAAPPS
jgi:hypothetical protein